MNRITSRVENSEIHTCTKCNSSHPSKMLALHCYYSHPLTEQDLADEIHDRTCTLNHPDGCEYKNRSWICTHNHTDSCEYNYGSWIYPNLTRQRYLYRARSAIEKANYYELEPDAAARIVIAGLTE